MLSASDIVNHAVSLGYEKCGIVKIDSMKGYAEKLQQRIDRFPEVKEK